MLAKIGQYNLSKNIISDTYSVNQRDIYEGWTDGWGHNHRDVYGTRISGGFEIGFNTEDEYVSIVNAMKEARNSDGTYTMKVFVSNMNEEVISDFYIDFPGTISKNINGVKRYSNVYITVEEK